MAEPFLAEIKMVGFNFAPRGWAQCDGQILPISQNQSLYALLGTTYGGDGRTSFALPDLRGRAPVHPGSDGGVSVALGQKAGAEDYVLAENQLPAHTHTMQATAAGTNSSIPDGNVLATAAGGRAPLVPYGTEANEDMAPTVAATGTAVNNMQPYTGVNFCIAIRGLFPSRN